MADTDNDPRGAVRLGQRQPVPLHPQDFALRLKRPFLHDVGTDIGQCPRGLDRLVQEAEAIALDEPGIGGLNLREHRHQLLEPPRLRRQARSRANAKEDRNSEGGEALPQTISRNHKN